MHSYVFNRVHVVFNTNDRRPLIAEEIQSRLWELIGGVIRQIGAHPIRVGGSTDHVHVLCGIPPNLRLAEVVQKMKANSSRWLRQEMGVKLFSWQPGYAAFSVSNSRIEATIRYINGQAEHHKRRYFEAEWKGILAEYGIEL